MYMRGFFRLSRNSAESRILKGEILEILKLKFFMFWRVQTRIGKSVALQIIDTKSVTASFWNAW